MRDRVIAELNHYRAAVAGITDDIMKLEVAGAIYNRDSVHDHSAPYHAIAAVLLKRGICGGAASGFALVGNAIGVPTFSLSVILPTGENHAVNLVRPNGGELKIIDVVFGKRNPKVVNIADSHYRIDWHSDRVLGFMRSHYFPNVDIIGQLGGIGSSSNHRSPISNSGSQSNTSPSIRAEFTLSETAINLKAGESHQLYVISSNGFNNFTVEWSSPDASGRTITVDNSGYVTAQPHTGNGTRTASMTIRARVYVSGGLVTTLRCTVNYSSH